MKAAMKTANTRLLVVVSLAMVLSACVSGGTVSEQRQSVQQMRSETLTKLYKIEPGAREHIRGATGYAVFSNIGVNVIFFSAGGGHGIVRDNRNGHDTYMNMGSAGIGLGMGIKDFRGIFVFTRASALDQFINSGWDASAQADAAAASGGKGGAWAGAVDVAPGIKLYQITENGLALQATIQGTKYWKDGDLN